MICPNLDQNTYRSVCLVSGMIVMPDGCKVCMAQWKSGPPKKVSDLPAFMTSPVVLLGVDKRPEWPSPLAMIRSVVSSVLRFAWSGLKMVSHDERQARLDVCHQCPNHDRGRCRSCGCFVSIKALMATEDCPKGWWPKLVRPVWPMGRPLDYDGPIPINAPLNLKGCGCGQSSLPIINC